jgi:hypothetical protein
MKLTKQVLKKLIKEEIAIVIESFDGQGIKDPIGDFIRQAHSWGEENGYWVPEVAVDEYLKLYTDEQLKKLALESGKTSVEGFKQAIDDYEEGY